VKWTNYLKNVKLPKVARTGGFNNSTSMKEIEYIAKNILTKKISGLVAWLKR
jgi:hypothetical protein